MTGLPRYRKRPTETLAVQLRWSTWGEVCQFLGAEALHDANPEGAWDINADEASDTCGETGPTYLALNVRTVHGELAVVRHGDWILPEAASGRFYPVKPDVFDRTYELVSEEPTS
jgi:hypothetical protein